MSATTALLGLHLVRQRRAFRGIDTRLAAMDRAIALAAARDPAPAMPVMPLAAAAPAPAKTEKGEPGRGVRSMQIDPAGDLIATYTDGTTENTGRARGEDGKKPVVIAGRGGASEARLRELIAEIGGGQGGVTEARVVELIGLAEADDVTEARVLELIAEHAGSAPTSAVGLAQTLLLTEGPMITMSASDTINAIASVDGAVSFAFDGMRIAADGTETIGGLPQGLLSAAAAAIWSPTPGTAVARLQFSEISGGDVVVQLFRNGTDAAHRLVSFTIPARGSASFGGGGVRVYNEVGAPVT